MRQSSLLAGTSKGLVILRPQQDHWVISDIQFSGLPVSMVFSDPRNGCWWVCLAHRHWGAKLHRSFDEGKHWEEVPMPVYPEYAQDSKGQRVQLKKIWAMQQAGPDRPGGLWLGTEPGGLFYSAHNGDDFELVEALWNHPSRKDQQQWFGAGRDHPFIHSIEVDPQDSRHLYIAVSCAGVFETRDGGASWAPRNKGLIAAYLPNPNVEVGHDPHRLLICQSAPHVLWQQNHCGIFRSIDAGQYWENVTDRNKLAEYGFSLAIDHQNPLRAWVIPAESDERRVAVKHALCVCYTEDGGKTWRAQRQGLPQHHAFDIVFRHSFAMDGETLAFGTTTGNLYLSTNGGVHWNRLSSNLARIDYLIFSSSKSA